MFATISCCKPKYFVRRGFRTVCFSDSAKYWLYVQRPAIGKFAVWKYRGPFVLDPMRIFRRFCVWIIYLLFFIYLFQNVYNAIFFNKSWFLFYSKIYFFWILQYFQFAKNIFNIIFNKSWLKNITNLNIFSISISF